MFGLRHVDPEIRIRIKDKELTFVIANRRRPDAIAVLWFVKDVFGHLLLEDIPNDGPINQVLGVKYGQSRRGVEAGGCQIKIVANTDYIGVGVVSIEDRVFVSAVAIIGNPNFRNVGSAVA